MSASSSRPPGRREIAQALGLTPGQVSHAERSGLAKLRTGERRRALEDAVPEPREWPISEARAIRGWR